MFIYIHIYIYNFDPYKAVVPRNAASEKLYHALGEARLAFSKEGIQKKIKKYITVVLKHLIYVAMNLL